MLKLSDQNKLILGIIIVALGIAWPSIKKAFVKVDDQPFGNSSYSNVVFEKVAEPNDSMKRVTDGISELVSGPDADLDRVRLAQFYAQLSHVIKNEKFIETTKQFRDFNSMSGQINFAGISLKDKYSGLGKAIDDAIVKVVGLDNVSLDEGKRKDLADVLAAISWELWHE